MNPRILIYDLETTPRKVWVWGQYEQNVLRVVEESYILCVAYKWLGEETEVIFTKTKNDKKLVKKLHKLLDDADIVIAHNGKRFDNKWANKQFLKHGLDPVSSYQTIDTLKEARKYFNFPSNSLNNLGQQLKVGKKVKHEGIDLWLKAMQRDKKAIKKMTEYAKQDVDLLEKVYLKIRPFMDTHPNLNQYEYSILEPKCPACLSTNVIRKGKRPAGRFSVKQRFKCKDCGKWGQSGSQKIQGLNIS